ncbi:MAG: HAD family hydrolase [Betaproteobacteria bacterium]|nr:MAG: HAD family hydrolase [Betaproteobacteria bacterium]
MRYRLIVFDWDGTIIDSHGAIVACMQEASRELGLAIPERERASHVIGLSLHEILRIVAPDLPAARYPEYIAAYRRHFLAREDSMQLFPGMRNLLEGLSRSHVLGIATGKSRKGLERALAAAGLGELFAASRCADETDPKPHPAMLLELMEELKVSADGVLMIGDTSHDMQMARAAGVDAVAVAYGAHPEEGLRACEPLDCFSDVAQLRVWLTSNA